MTSLKGYIRSGDTYTVNGIAEMIKEIVAKLKDEGLEITFRLDSGYFDDAILETIKSLGGKYVIKGKRVSDTCGASNRSIDYLCYRRSWP